MREIRFRGWHTTQKKMFSPEEMAADQLTLLPTGQFINVSGTSTRLSEIFSRDEFTPLQYTGLKDKNGKEIYEGDIVLFEMPGFGVSSKRVVEWNGKDYGPTLEGSYHREVLGNLYENPELLDDKV